MILTEKIPEIPMARSAEWPYPGGFLGRHVEHDERSRGYAHPEMETHLLMSVEWPRRSPILDQGQTSSCTGNALAGALATDSVGRMGRSDVDEPLAETVYELATHLDTVPGAMPPDDTGSTGNAVCKAAVKLGLIAGYQHAFSFNAVLSALQKGPVIAGISWLTGCDTPDPHGIIDYSGNIRGGHEFLIRGVDMVGQFLLGDNSWALRWGLNGTFKIPFNGFQTALNMRGDVTIPLWG